MHFLTCMNDVLMSIYKYMMGINIALTGINSMLYYYIYCYNYYYYNYNYNYNIILYYL